LAFILCGEPGLNFECLNIGLVKEEKDVETKGRTGRMAMRNLKRENNDETGKMTPGKSDSIAIEALSIKKSELKFKQSVFEERRKEKQLKGIILLRDELQKNGMTETEEYKNLQGKYLKLLRESIESNEVNDDDNNNSKVRVIE
jgi:hypothetical protein